MDLDSFIFKHRNDVFWFSQDENGNCDWDKGLANQPEIEALITRYKSGDYTINVIPKNISSKQIRLGLLSSGFSLQMINDAISQMPEPQKSYAQITWEYATVFEREHPMIESLGTQLGLTSEQIDQLFIRASEL